MTSLATILENVPIAENTYRLRLESPAIARMIRPGQFVMIRPGDGTLSDPLLGRPLALYDVVRNSAGNAVAFDVVYLVVGRGTAALSRRRPGERLSLWGPLGNGFGPPPVGSVVFVAGGIGQTPFLALGRWWLGRERYGEGVPGAQMVQSHPATVCDTFSQPLPNPVTLLYGARTASMLAGLDDFLHAGIEVEVATDDGTKGHHGYVTELVGRRLENGERPSKVIGCGPPAMLASLARLTESHGISCDVSLENHMACGIGVCFSCVAPIRQQDGSVDLRRVCLEGPVVPAKSVDWSNIGIR